MVRRWMVLVGLGLALLVAAPLVVQAQEPDPCTVYEVGSEAWHRCYDELREANMRAQRQQLLCIGTAALVFVGVLISASTARSAIRMKRGSGELRALMQEMVPPEAAPLPPDAVEKAVRELTTFPVGSLLMIVPLFLGIVLIFYLSQLFGFGLLTQAVIAAYIGLVVVAAIISLIIYRRALTRESQWLKPLGLRVTNLPEIVLRQMGGSLRTMAAGNTVLGGTRFGRQVTIRFGLGPLGRPLITTHVQASAPMFEVKAGDPGAVGTLPSAVSRVLDAHGPLDRRVQVRGDAEGITVERQQTSAKTATAQGIAEWVGDLRLAEQLADALTASSW